MPLNKLWLNPGMRTYHFNHSLGYNGDNYGFGLEYEINNNVSVTIGKFYSSIRKDSEYIGAYIQPIHRDGFKLGAVVGFFNGYEYNNGKWFPAVLPVITYKCDSIGYNVTIIPTIGHLVNGAVSLQVKFKLN